MAKGSGKRRRRANGTGTAPVYNEDRKRWVIRVTMGLDELHRPVRREVSARTLAEVEQKATELKRQRDAGVGVEGSKLTVAGWLTEWLDHRSDLAPKTLQNYRDVARCYIEPHLGRDKLDSLTPRRVRTMLTALEREGHSPNTRRLARTILGTALRQAVADGLLMRNVVEPTKGPGSKRVREGRTLDVDQANRLLAHVRGTRLGVAYTLGLVYGLRRGEILGLSWTDVHLDGPKPRIELRWQLQRLPDQGLVLANLKTDRSRRTLGLTPEMARLLREQRLAQQNDRQVAGSEWETVPGMQHLVFTSALGRPVDPDWFTKVFGRVSAAAGLGHWTPHELRHSAASIMLALGVPLERVSENLGHSSVRITADVYRHSLGHESLEAAEVITAALRLA